MVTVSADGNSITTSDDFNRLQAQFAQVSFINTPAQSAAPQTQPATCPAQGTAFLATTTLPETPSDQVCECVTQNALSCAFTSTSDNTAPIIGELLNYACSQLGTLGGTCDPIGSNGATGVYGVLAECDPCKYFGIWTLPRFSQIALL